MLMMVMGDVCVNGLDICLKCLLCVLIVVCCDCCVCCVCLSFLFLGKQTSVDDG